MNIVILTGGVGTRLWPMGRRNNPKQFFPMISHKPLVKETYDRFVKTYGAHKIYFSVTQDLLKSLRKVFPKIPLRQFIVEPERRDTAPAMGFVAAYLSLISPDEPMVFVPSDHFIADTKKFLRCFKVGEQLIKRTGSMVDIGVVASMPSTVMGYTRLGKIYKKINGTEVYHFEKHTEKPNQATAIKYITSGKYLWHGNYYMWTPRKFLEAIEKHSPRMGTALRVITGLLKENKSSKIGPVYASMEKISFDYAVTEKIDKKQVFIIKGDFGWSDVGAWDMLHNQLRHLGDKKGNVLKGEVIHIDTKNSLLYTYSKKVLATVGLENIVVIDTEDALLVCPLNRAQEVKKLFPELEKKGLTRYL